MKGLRYAVSFSRYGLLSMLAVLFIAGCMGGRTITMDVKYDATRKAPPPFPQTSQLKVALIPFQKEDGVKDVFGKWVGLRGKEDLFASTLPLDEAVTLATYEYLKKAGFDVELAPKGSNLDSFATAPPDLAIGGDVQRFDIDAVSHFGSTQIKSNFKLKVLIKNVKDGSVLTVNIEGSSDPKTVVTFDRGIFKNTVTGVLSESIERIFSNTVLRDGFVRPGA